MSSFIPNPLSKLYNHQIKRLIMKRLIFLAIVMSVFVNLSAQTFYNNTDCDLTVTQNCYDNSCFLVSSNVYPVQANNSVPITSCSPYQVGYEIAWDPNPCVSGPMPNPPIKMGACGGNTSPTTMGTCDYCSTNNGQATITLLSNGDVDVSP